MKYKAVCLCLACICVFSFLSCIEIGMNTVNFDREKFSDNKKLWNENLQESYEFSYSIWTSAGALFEADVAVNNGVSIVDIKTIFNREPSAYPSEELNRKIEYCKKIGLYITSVEDIFSYIEELYDSSKKEVEEDPEIYSVTIFVNYDDNYGIPVEVKKFEDTKEKLIGFGPDLYIENFKFL